MTRLAPLLIELGTEELPVKALPGLARALFDGVVEGLGRHGIAVEPGAARPLYTPRRLAVLLPRVGVRQSEQRSEVLGPYLNIALDADGQPTRALQGFAAKAGVDWSALERTTDQKGERFVHRAVKPGADTATLLPEILGEALAAMPVPKPMRWGDHAHAFARPVHWLVMLMGEDVVDGEAFGVGADRMSRGHRFMHDRTVWIARPEDYIDALRGARVLVDPEERRARIVEEVTRAAHAAGGAARIEPGNLEEVNCLVEWPEAVTCSFEPEYLAVPQEALVATMEANQKFFPVLGPDGRLREHFVGIANILSRDQAEVRKGYERVIRPRFADARFFFVEDMKQGMASMNAGLRNVTYQQKLGSVADKVARVAALAEAVAARVGVDPALARRAAELSKADLQSRMVGEFPELQGIAGRYYASQDPALDGLPHEERLAVANAIDEAYRPRQAGDDIALSGLGKVLAIAERLDTLAGGFAAGLKPTGNKDPFALRRNALGLARTVIESGYDLDLGEMLAAAVDRATRAIAIAGAAAQQKRAATEAGHSRPPRPGDDTGSDAAPAADEIYDFVLDRLRGYYAERGVPPQHFAAVAEKRPPSLYDFDRRIAAIGSFADLPEATALAAADKRIRNILRKAGDDTAASIDPTLLREPAERALAEAVEAVYAETGAALASGDYVDALSHLARLRPQVDAFFDAVMVNDEDPALRRNRLALLRRLGDRLGSVAAIEQLST
ncbi:glycine--tRNA ligase subunit beta [Luteimonas sp. RD2P54]|uniref:Glycine--tRNA ligase beta subunit n=1 Tax=Luteimonas endophytica TaxID=3042023 RepID=A0ABT6J5H5_9GAMM|nr:glycine--tRNA ligase subunit beta [Luteimonas endophytica]MDH5822060.1 glycine--tRNA ligase subunit beta [Luteimonas endophytica]